jgi:hypothetical protein
MARISGENLRPNGLRYSRSVEGNDRRQVARTAAQRLREVFAWDTAPRFLLRDREQDFWKAVCAAVAKAMGMKQVFSTPSAGKIAAILEVSGLHHRCVRHAA